MRNQSSGKKAAVPVATASRDSRATGARRSDASTSGRKRAAGNRRRRRGSWTAVAYLIIAALVLAIAIMLIGDRSLIHVIDPVNLVTTPTPSPTPTPEEAPVTPAPTPTPVPTPTPTPVPTPTPKGYQELDADAVASRADDADIGLTTKVYANGVLAQDYQIPVPVRMGDATKYTALEGVTTFRGNNYRDSAAYGHVPVDSSTLTIAYSFKIGDIDSWSGVGWTGQPAIVRWDAQTRQLMNINEEKKAKEGLVEVIYATMDGRIYFFDLEDGKETRPAINIGAPIKGSVTIDPRGYPLLYCGQGIDEVKGQAVDIGMRVFSLIDQSQLLFIDGRDEFATRKWYASDCAPLVDAASDRLLWNGENGILYSILLGARFDRAAGTISIDPVIDRYWYESKVSTRPGMESSLALYNHYAFLTDNSGLLQCVDVNTLSPVWAFYAGDDTDATPVLEADDFGGLALYTATELDLNKKAGTIAIRRLDALTGAQVWIKQVKVTDSERGGAFSTPALGKGSVSDMVFFNIARTEDGNVLFALDKETGEEIWKLDIGGYSWSSPTLTYDENGRAYILLGNYNGALRLIDAKNGALLTKIDLEEGNMEASPAIYGDTLVIGTRGRKIFAVKIG